MSAALVVLISLLACARADLSTPAVESCDYAETNLFQVHAKNHLSRRLGQDSNLEMYDASTSRFGSDGTAVAGRNSTCGGGLLGNIADSLKDLGIVAMGDMGEFRFFGVAPAESMYQVDESYSVDGETCGHLAWNATPCGCCPAMRGSPAAAHFSGVLHVGCGSCLVFTASGGNKEGAKIGAVVVDTCPYFQNKEWCPANGKANTIGKRNHLDILYLGKENDAADEAEVIKVIGDMPNGTIQHIRCPDAVVRAINNVGTGTALCNDPCPGFEVFGCEKSTHTKCMSDEW